MRGAAKRSAARYAVEAKGMRSRPAKAGEARRSFCCVAAYSMVGGAAKRSGLSAARRAEAAPAAEKRAATLLSFISFRFMMMLHIVLCLTSRFGFCFECDDVAEVFFHLITDFAFSSFHTALY
jgi:hypothetical protein